MKNTFLLIIIVSALVVLPAVAQEQPHNDPLSIISNRPRPNVLLLVDTSGSMLWAGEKPDGQDITVRLEESLRLVSGTYQFGSDTHKVYLIDSDNLHSRLGQAKSAIREMSYQIPDVNLGVGQFKKTLLLNRFRGRVPADYQQKPNLPGGYHFEFIDGQDPSEGEINVPEFRRDVSSHTIEYPFARIVRRFNESTGPVGSMWTTYDPIDVVWSSSSSSIEYFSGGSYIRLNWMLSEIENARYMQYRALTADGEQIFRDSFGAPDATHRNKLNQLDNIDIFLSDLDFIQLKQNTQLGEPLQVERYVEDAYGAPLRSTVTFYYYPTTADWDGNTSCAGGEVLVDIQDRFLDDLDTPEDESDNKDEVSATAGPITDNALIYDFTVEPPELTDLGPFYGAGGTAIGSTLDAAFNYFQNSVKLRDLGYDVDHCRDNFVILLTDGYETCGGTPENVAASLYENLGVKVYVIAFVTTTEQADAIAVAGGTEAAFYAESREELIDALKTIFANIKASVQLATPVATTTIDSAETGIEGDVVLLPFFDFPGFAGRLQARKLFRFAVVSADPKTGAILTDAEGNPIVIEDDIDEARILQLINDPTDPITKDPSREIVGLQLDPPEFLWDAGELLSQQVVENENPDVVYEYLLPDDGDLDGDGDFAELVINPAYKTADQRNILTTLEYTVRPPVVEFSEADLVDDPSNRDTAAGLLGAAGWSDQELRFLINYARGKVVRRFTEETVLYGRTYSPGDPMPDPESADDDGDGVPDGILYTERKWKLGDIISSTPVVVTPPSGTYPITIDDNNDTTHDFDEFVEANADIPSIAIVGGNDGMLHGFSVKGIDLNDDGDFEDVDEYYPGEEVWSFVLTDTMYKLAQLYFDSLTDDDFEPDGQKFNPHTYFVDAPMTLAILRARVHDGDTDGDGKSTDPEFRIMLFTGEGRGGNRYWAFDVTDPMNPIPVWSLGDPAMGMTISRPAVGPVQVGASEDLDTDDFKYFVFMGSGYDYSQSDGSATVGNVFYQVDVNDGTIVNTFNAGDAMGGAGLPNAIVGRAILADDNQDFFVERAYFGDLDGNFWRWKLNEGTIENLLDIPVEPLTTQSERLERPILDCYTYANVFGSDIVTVATGGDTRLYIADDMTRASYPTQRIYLLIDEDKEGRVRSLLNGQMTDLGDYEETGDTVGVDLPSYRVGENVPVFTVFTEYDEEGKIYRGFQTIYPIYIPDPEGLRTISCAFGSSEMVILDNVFSESNIVESTAGFVIDMGEGKATGISYVGGNILFSIGDQFKVYGNGIYRFESSRRVKARLKVLEWREIF